MSDASTMTAHPASRIPHPASLTEFHKAWAYLKKELLIQSSYRFAFILSLFGVFTGIASYFFIDRMFGRRITPELAPFGTSYFAYVLVGNAFFAYVGTALGGISGRVASEQILGTLEAILTTPTRLHVLIVAMVLWNTLYATSEVLLFFLVGGIGFGVDFSRINWGSLLVFLGLVIITFNSVGLLEAGSMLIFKRGTPLAWAVNGLSALLGGVFFPVTVLPTWAQRLAAWNPITHAIRGLQLAIYQGTPLARLGHELAILGVCAAVLAPLGWWSWRWALDRVRMDGSLSQY